MNKEELFAYLAGFFDGEGSIRLSPFRGRLPLGISISQTTIEPLLLFKQIFPKGNVSKGTRKTKGGLDYFRYRVASKEGVSILLQSLYPYLIVKKSKAKQVLMRLNGDIKDSKLLPVPVPYMAGFFDAEGSISVRVRCGNKLQPRVRISQTCIEPLLIFKEYFEGNLREKKRKTVKGSPVFQYTLNLRQNDFFCETLQPYSIVKSPQIQLLLQMSRIKLNTTGKDKRIPDKWILAKKITDLNSRKGKKEASKVLQMFPLKETKVA